VLTRLRIMDFGTLGVFLLLCACLFDLQIIQGPAWKEQVEKRAFRPSLTAYRRGSISASDGTTLATDRAVFDLVGTPGELFPVRASLLLLLDQLDRSARKEKILLEEAAFKRPPSLTLEALERKWASGPSRVFVRMLCAIPFSRKVLLKGLPGGLKAAFSFRWNHDSLPGKRLWDMWFEPGRLGAAPPRDGRSLCELIRALCRKDHAFRAFLARLKRLLGLDPAGGLSPLDPVFERCFALEREVVLLEDLPEEEGSRLRRHVNLRWRYFKGIKVKAIDQGGLFFHRFKWQVSLRAPTRRPAEKLRRILSAFGRPELVERYRKGCRRILSRFFEPSGSRLQPALLERAERRYWRSFRAFLKEKGERVREKTDRKFVLAWELAEAERSRYLEHALFSHTQMLVPDVLRFGRAGLKCVSVFPEGEAVQIRIRHVRRYPLGEPVATLVGLARRRDRAGQENFGGSSDKASDRSLIEALWEASDRKQCFRTLRLNRTVTALPWELIGIQGIERLCDAQLRGYPGLHLRTSTEALTVPPLNGQDLKLTVDPQLTIFLYKTIDRITREQGFADRQGFAIVSDVRDGSLLALVSFPGFEPEKYVSGDESYLRYLQALHRRQAAPLINHCFLPQLPGSVFKLVVAAAALEENAIAPSRRLFCPGNSRPKWFCQNHAAAELNLHDALVRSCNAYFAEIGTEALGAERLQKWVHRLGMDGTPPYGLSRVNAELLGREPGNGDPVLERPRRVDFTDKRPSVQAMMCYGSGPIAILPLSIIQFVAAVARGGAAPPPHLLASTPPSAPLYHLSPRTCRILRKAMWDVVHHRRGTAHPVAKLREFSVAAKTGTAELGKDVQRNNAWIVGFAPYKEPRYAFVVCVERVGQGVHGAQAAGPILAAALEFLSARCPELKKETAGK